MKKKTKAYVLSQEKLAPSIYSLWLKTEIAREAHAGQFVGVYPKNASTLLPRPISICEVSDDFSALRLVYRVAGKGTDEFSYLKEGDEVYILGVLGNGYLFTDMFGEDLSRIGHNIVLMGGGIGIPPMLELAKELNAHRIPCTAVLGYRNSDLFLSEEFKKYSELVIATEDGSVGTKGNVIDAMNVNNISADVIMACGPMPMLRGIKTYVTSKKAEGEDIRAYISLEERMACGVGACLGCVTKTKNVDEHSHVNNARICTDGPVFDCEEVMI